MAAFDWLVGKKLKNENEELKKSVVELKNENEELKKSVVELKNENEELKKSLVKYSGIIDIDSEIAKRKDELTTLNNKLAEAEKEFRGKTFILNEDYQRRKAIYDNLQSEITILDSDLENISYGLYKPQYDFNTSEDYKRKLEERMLFQKQCIKDNNATYCSEKWQVGDSRKQGERMTIHYSKLMLRAFNGECTAAISRAKWNNIVAMESRIKKSYEAINKLGETLKINITPEYFNFKMEELSLEFELQEKHYQEKEEQRKIREQMREEEKVQKEIEKAMQEAEEEEEKDAKALLKAKAEIEKAQGQELVRLNEKIKVLEENLRKAQEQKERAISRAQLTKSGHVYIISNIGSFGNTVYKIGMTRRLEPIERVKELGDASVPFDFDVHGMIYSENAPDLESNLHKKLNHKRVNLVNRRAEFFNTTINEIETIVKELNLNIQLMEIAEAKEYRETLSILNAQKQTILLPEKETIFPDALI